MTSFPRRLLPFLSLAGAVLGTVGGCSAVVALDSHPCTQDIECSEAFPGGATSCDVKAGVCVVPSGSDGPPCSAHFECNQDADLGGDELCIAGQCQRVLGPIPGGGGECTELVGEITDDPLDTVLVPAIICRSGAESFGPAFSGVELAVRDVNSNGGLAKERRMLVLSCDPGGDEQGAANLARFAAETLGSPLVIGPTNANLAFVGNEAAFADAGTVVVTMNPDAGISALRPDGRVFRTFASDLAIVEVATNLITDRYVGSRVQVLASATTDVTRRWADEFGAHAQESGLVVKRRDYEYDPVIQDSSSLEEAARQLKVADGFAPDFLVISSNIEVAAVVDAYALAFDGTFPEETRIIVCPYGFFGLQNFAASHPELLPRTDLPLPDFTPGDGFVSRMGASFNITDGSVLAQAGLLFDITMLAALAYSKSADATLPEQLADVLREGVSGGTGTRLDIASDGSAFGMARQTLGSGDALQYVLAGGQTVLTHNSQGEMTSSRFGSLTIGADQTPVPRRVFVGEAWVDLCDPSVDEPCGPWNDEPDAPSQSCVDLDEDVDLNEDGPLPALCLPECRMGTCPVFSCEPQVQLCMPPPS